MINPQPQETVASVISVDGLEKIFLAGPFSAEDTTIERIKVSEPVDNINLHTGPIYLQLTSALINGSPDFLIGTDKAKKKNEQSPPSPSKLNQELIQSTDKVSRTDLVSILESFVKIIRTSDSVPAQLIDGRVAALAVDRTKEIDEMKRLLLEAQDTIIKLLTDRVEDRAKIASLEAEVRLLPDIQTQAKRAMQVAMNTEDFRDEVTKVKYELECMKLAKLRAEIERSRTSWLDSIRSWISRRRER
jgi:hypothetical protein